MIDRSLNITKTDGLRAITRQVCNYKLAMSEELMKYLPHVPDLNKKKNPLDRLKKPQCVDKEVLNLTGGLFPARVVDPAIQLVSAV